MDSRNARQTKDSSLFFHCNGSMWSRFRSIRIEILICRLRSRSIRIEILINLDWDPDWDSDLSIKIQINPDWGSDKSGSSFWSIRMHYANFRDVMPGWVGLGWVSNHAPFLVGLCSWVEVKRIQLGSLWVWFETFISQSLMSLNGMRLFGR